MQLLLFAGGFPRAQLRDRNTDTARCTSHSICLVTRRQVLVGLSALPIAALADTQKPAYDNFAEGYDKLDGSNALTKLLGFTDLRANLLSRASGRVLEMGIGTGVNIPFYNSRRVLSVTGIDVSSEMLSRARLRAKETDIPVSLIRASAADTALPEEFFDTIVDTFCLCVYEQPRQVLQEMRRVIKPDGRVLLLEHSVSDNGLVATYQNIIARPTAILSKGCYPNQRVKELVTEAGFQIVNIHTMLAGTIIELELAT
ncbi:Phosphatidylethanolamine N-methyltransferase [Gracilariopsis chorda]|uniref:Phosphatidylethanolamine N-methyltransferase n=1 Tax=Gracilariopsis chorda TaxID=448386 RepID=A0A2V3IML7_9FLOR|nr:Phosphatidylethanolamine N-methyltransferase [Gracilariopsis chorda]|eukprot:PXF43321.1 Phosphatidylethanolamine N-methyltransferase [Gracilariopsis chorda]